jgi:ATP-dependent DNA helicase RecG
LFNSDYSHSRGIRIFRSPTKFEFFNPGILLVDPENLDVGGRSESRNPILQDLFRFIGIGERAGSGIPAILRAWKEQQWRHPILDDDVASNETHLALSMVNLFPAEVVEKLTTQFSERFSSLPDTKRLALCLAEFEGGVTNRQLQKLSDQHGRDITFILRDLVNDGFLLPYGEGRGRKYSITNSTFDALNEHNNTSSEHNNTSSEHNNTSSEQSIALDLTLAQQVRTKNRASKDLVISAILQLCAGPPVTLEDISQQLGRAPDTIRVHYLSKMISDGSLTLLYPDQPTHPKQAYKVPL